MGDLGALQSEPRREQIERVILLLKLSAAAFVQVSDVTRDREDGEDGGWRNGLRAQQVNDCWSRQAKHCL